MSAFDDSCNRAATEFLQTVVVVDNMASYDVTHPLLFPPGDLVEPDIFASADTGRGEVIAPRTPPDALDAAAVSQSFAQAGLVCSILKPTQAERLEEEVLKAAARADILVLDWQMDDAGALAITIIRRLVEQDEAAGGRLRLIAIYTAQSPLAPVRDSLEENSPKLERGAGFALVCGNTRVIFLTKSAASVAPGEAGLSVEPERLPSRLIEEFAAFAGGLLPNATLAAISGLRRHTHRVLARFDRDLDGPFLTHRALLPAPIDAEQYAATLILAELEAQVPLDRIVGEYLGKQQIREYLEHRMQEGLRPSLMLDKNGTKLQELDLDKTCELIEGGIAAFTREETAKFANDANMDKPERLYDTLRASLHERLYTLIDGAVASGKANHERFAVVAKLKRDLATIREEEPATWPKLRLGTLVADTGTGTHWMCVTPLCDSERLPAAGGRFTFVFLEKSEDEAELFIRHGDSVLTLSSSLKRTNLVTHIVKPNDSGAVRVQFENHLPIFTTTPEIPVPWQEPVTFKWIGELKPLQAQRFVQRLATSLSRIGLDDFEWHRMRERDTDL